MKRILLSLSIACITICAWGAKAYHLPVTVTQADGKPLTIVQFGDEDMNYVTTTDGVLLYQEGCTYYVATVSPSGELVKTNVLAHNAGQRTQDEIRLIAAQEKSRFFEQTDVRARKARRERMADDDTLFPHTGTPTALVILADFTDQKFKNDSLSSIQIFDQYLNAEGVPTHPADATLSKNNLGSVRKYFYDMSNGSFEPRFDVKALVHLSGPMKNYGAGDNDNMSKFIPEVCCLAQQAGVDFSKYDANNDGKVDLVYIIYAGYGQNFSGNNSNTIWAKSGGKSFGTFDGKEVYRYGVHCELNFSPAIINSTDYNFGGVPQIHGIGLFCHEFSHCLGLPDFYPTDKTSQKQGLPAMEFWDLMDGGEYTANGYRPTAYTAWEREYLGWMDIETLTDEYRGQRIRLVNIDRNGGKAYRVFKDGETSGSEYIMLQNIQSYAWNTTLGNMAGGTAHGMLVYHVDFNSSFKLTDNSVNNTKGTPRMNVLPADGELISSYLIDDENGPITTAMYKESHGGDPYPGSQNKLSATSFKVNSGSLTKALLNIQETSGIVTFDFMEESDITKTIPQPAPEPTEASENVANITSNHYNRGDVQVKRSTTLIEKVQLADGDDAYRLSDFVSMSTGLNTAFDLSNFKTLHVDIYPLEDMTVNVSLFADNSNEKNVTLKANQWNAVDIPISDLTDEGFDLKTVYGITLSGGTGQTLYIDNAYFSKTPSSGIFNLKTDAVDPDHGVYTLDGRFVGSSLTTLPKGIYIVNGKKVVKQ